MPSGAASEKQRSEAQYLAAIRNFEAGVRLFQKQNYEKSKEIFAKLATAPAREVASRARVYLRMCEQKLNPPEAAPKTAAEYYDLGVAQLNARNLEAAVEYLSKADKLAPTREHIRYALAAAHALLGNADAALEHLNAAIELRSANRFLAAKDEDFQPLATDPRFARLLHSRVS